MRYAKLLPCLLILITSFIARADPRTDTLEDIAMGIREHFPRAEISAFSCAGATCSKKINFVWFSAYIVVTMGTDARPAAIAVVTARPRAASADVQELFDAAFKACAVAVVSLIAQDMAWDQRTDLAAKAIAGEASTTYGN